jgi:hypothetical protein
MNYSKVISIIKSLKFWKIALEMKQILKFMFCSISILFGKSLCLGVRIYSRKRGIRAFWKTVYIEKVNYIFTL